MKRLYFFIFSALMTLVSTSVSAQSITSRKELTDLYHLLARIGRYVQERGVLTAKCSTTENIYYDDTTTVWQDKYLTCDSINNFFEQGNIDCERSFMDLCFRLTEETDEKGKIETVLHCYLRMPADAIKGVWLWGDETYIVDTGSGVHYKPRRSTPDVYGKHFGIRAPKGTIIDLPIYFPELSDSCTQVAVYGVPLWSLRGEVLDLKGKVFASKFKYPRSYEYDKKPNIHLPHLVREEKAYNKDNSETWAVFNNAYTIKPARKSSSDRGDGPASYAIWMTPETTYIALAMEQNWKREYFGIPSGTVLIDQDGKEYRLRKIQGFPTDHIFWHEGTAGDWLAFVLEFEPLPLTTSYISYIEPASEPFDAWGATWDGHEAPILYIHDLKENQHDFEYFKPITIE